MNEGGLLGEREGWHLPGFDTASASFSARELSAGLPGGQAGVGFFVTTFELDLPSGTDPSFRFVFDGGAGHSGQAYRALLFVNGWKFGKVRSSRCARAREPALTLSVSAARGRRRAAGVVPGARWHRRPEWKEVSAVVCSRAAWSLSASPTAPSRWRSGR